MLTLTVITALLAAGSLGAVIVYGRRNADLAAQAVEKTKAGNELARERSIVNWQAGRQDNAIAGWLYVANIGEDTAHDVTVLAWDGHDRVTVKADKVPPCLSDRKNGYIEFTLAHRVENGPDPTRAEENKPIMPPEESRAFQEFRERFWRPYEDSIAAEERRQVAVRIAWRSEHGRWSSKTLHTG